MSENTFTLGLTQAGATSGGAYSAGVTDFLLEALGEWAKAKANGEARENHRAEIKAITGASAGSINAALFPLVCAHGHQPLSGNSIPVPGENLYYDTWVRDIDFSDLLTTSDLKKGKKPKSLLNGDAIDSIREAILEKSYDHDMSGFGLGDSLHIMMSLSNLRGIPYAIKFAHGNARHEMSRHEDHIHFQWRRDGNQYHSAAIPLDLKKEDHRRDLVNAAVASGAFPIGLPARKTKNLKAAYEKRKWSVPQNYVEEGVCIKMLPIPPNWENQDEAIPFTAIDGGMMNNEPFELCRQIIADADIRNLRNSDSADRAVLMIDPFPNRHKFSENLPKNDDILSIAISAFSGLMANARFKLDELLLFSEDAVASRRVIGPVLDTQENYHPLASNLFYAFAGFFNERFRHHDFLLGRRNCQSFLKNYFKVRKTNHIVESWVSAEDPQKVPVIPLYGTASFPLPQPQRPTMSAQEWKTIKTQMKKRVNKLVKVTNNGYFGSWLMRKYIQLGWTFGKARVFKSMFENMEKKMRSEKLLV